MEKIKFLNFSFEYSVGSIIYKIENGKILFLLLHYSSGHWDFVKGHREEGESDIQTLKREAFEETGLADLKVVADFKRCSYYFYKAKKGERKKRIKEGRGVNIFKKVIFYLSETSSGKIDMDKIKKSHECQGFTWIEYNKALKRVSQEKHKKMLKAAIQLLQGAQI